MYTPCQSGLDVLCSAAIIPPMAYQYAEYISVHVSISGFGYWIAACALFVRPNATSRETEAALESL